MKHFKKGFFVFVLGLSFLSYSPKESLADFWAGTKYWGGYTNYVYSASVRSGGYAATYDLARNGWTGISSNVRFNESTHAYADKYHVGSTSTSGLWGKIFPRNQNGTLENLESNWAYVDVWVYDNQMDLDDLSIDERTNVSLHELGHSLKLEHTPDGYTVSSVMTATGSQYWITPREYDKGELRKKWGN